MKIKLSTNKNEYIVEYKADTRKNLQLSLIRKSEH